MYIRILQISEKKASAGRATCPPTSAQLAVGVVTAVVVALAVLAAVALAGAGRRHRVALTDAADALALAAARRRRVRRAASARDRQLALSVVVVNRYFVRHLQDLLQFLCTSSSRLMCRKSLDVVFYDTKECGHCAVSENCLVHSYKVRFAHVMVHSYNVCFAHDMVYSYNVRLTRDTPHPYATLTCDTELHCLLR